MRISFSKFLLAFSLLPGAFSHAGHESEAEIDLMARHAAKARRSLQGCSSRLRARDLEDRRLAKREEFVERAVGFDKRMTWMAKRQNSNPFTNVSCILTPQSETGPFYAEGEIIRSNITENQPGVPLLLDIQIVNVNTCEVMEGVMLDIWHSNATGIYSGFADAGRDTTFLRGLQPTDSDGVMYMNTIFPGHYTRRAIHIHVIAHFNGSVTGDTYIGGTNAHIGQMFFPQQTITDVEQLSPYTLNTVPLTTNDDDSVYSRLRSDNYDGLITVEQLGSTIQDGLLGYISIGIDPGDDNPTNARTTRTPGTGSTGAADSTTPQQTAQTGGAGTWQAWGAVVGVMVWAVIWGMGA